MGSIFTKKDCKHNHKNDEIKLRSILSRMFVDFNISKIIEKYYYTRCSFRTCSSFSQPEIVCPDCIKYIYTCDVVKTPHIKNQMICCVGCYLSTFQFTGASWPRMESLKEIRESYKYKFLLTNFSSKIFNYARGRDDHLDFISTLFNFCEKNRVYTYNTIYPKNEYTEGAWITFFCEDSTGDLVIINSGDSYNNNV